MTSLYFAGRSTAFLLAITIALAFTESAYASNCPGGAVPGLTQPQHALDSASVEGEAELRSVVNEYFDALRNKDWQRLDLIEFQRYGEMFISGDSHGPILTYNTSLELTKRLLAPYRFQTLSFTIEKVEIQGRQATVRAKVSMRVCEADTGAEVISFDEIERVLHLDNFQSSWKVIRGHEHEAGGLLTEQIKKADNPVERQFLLCQEDLSGLLLAETEFKREGIRLLERGSLEQAFAVFGLAQEIALHLRARATVSAELRLKRREADIVECRAAGRQKDLALNLLWAGQDYAELKDFGRAEDYLGESIKLLETLVDKVNLARENLAEAYMETAAVQLEQGKYPGAINSYKRSIDQYILIAAGGKAERSYAASKIDDAVISGAHLYAAQGKYAQAEEFIRSNSKRLESVGDTEDAILLLYVISLIEMSRGETVIAAANIEKLLPMLEQDGSEVEDREQVAAGIRLMLVILYGQHGNFVGAARHLEKMRTVDIKADEPEEAVAWGHLLQLMDGLLYGGQGNEELAASRVKRVIPGIMDTSLEKYDVPDILWIWSMGHASKAIFASNGDEFDLPQEVSNTSLRCLLFSVAMAEKSENMIQAARAHQILAGLYANKKDRSKEVEHYLKGLSFLEGKTLPFKERYAARQVADNILLNLGGAYSEQGKYKDAIASYQKILRQDGLRLYRLFDPRIYLEIAESYYSLKDFEEAVKYSTEAQRAAGHSNDRDTLEDSFLLAGHAYLALNQPKAARQSYQSAIDEVEAARSQIIGSEPAAAQFFEDKLTPYHAMTNMLLWQGDNDGALSYVEQSKSKVLLDVLKNGRKNRTPLMTARELKQEDDLRRRLMLLNQQVIRAQSVGVDAAEVRRLRNQRVEARLDYELFRARLYVNHPKLAGRPSDRRAEFNAEDAGQLLASTDEAALEFMVTKEKSYLFVLTKTGGVKGGLGGHAARTEVERRVYEINVEEEELQSLVNSFRIRVSHPEGVIGQRARELYDLLLGQTREHLAGKKSLIIIPDGVLWDLPFQALMPAEGHYLLEDSAVSYAPSLTALKEMLKVREERLLQNARAAGWRRAVPVRSAFQGPSLLAVGDPSGCERGKGCGELPPQAGTFKPLPATGRLAKRLRGLYGWGKSISYSGGEADEAMIKREMPEYQVIHIGTHGVLDNDNPMYSFLLLSAPPERGNDSKEGGWRAGAEDGFLETWELMDLNLKADMIVLSACDTARGQVRGGEGIVGLSWAALIAGSPTTVVGQWEVDETSTNELLYDFHKRWLKAKKTNPARTNVAATLRQSALALQRCNKYSHPYYWAGFSVVGVGR